MNQLFVNAVTSYTRDKVGDQELEVLHALFSEVTVLGFIALLFGVMIRSGKLHDVSDWFFQDANATRIPHEEHAVFGNATYNTTSLTGSSRTRTRHAFRMRSTRSL